MPILDHLFRSHPRSVGESYLEHALFASLFAARLFLAGGAALLHAVVPGLCETTASRLILAMHDDIVARRRGAARPQAIRAIPQPH